MKRAAARGVCFLAVAFLCGCATHLRNEAVRSAEGPFLIRSELNLSKAAGLFGVEPGALLASQELAVSDYGLVRVGEYRFRVGGLQPEVLPAETSLQVVAAFAGRVVSTNADAVEPGRAVWELLPGDPLDLHLRVREWMPLRLILIAAAAFLFWFFRRSSSPS